jgi:hypothetical protein
MRTILLAGQRTVAELAIDARPERGDSAAAASVMGPGYAL